ncbi:HAD family hydrolase [Nocardioides speluncae]|uniref:HAD family hydrolase n=1 Tax=Nocardioides speluncae TaxID=2670337 RepID=UPI000D692CA5|nr:HAD-IA family hydrolase [Nocardioides speluncae]
MVRHVLLDADDVLQVLPGGWLAALEVYCGKRADEFLTAINMAEQPSMRGDEPGFFPALKALVTEYKVPASAFELLVNVWHRIEVLPHTADLVAELRGRGYGVHLATNQPPERAAYMREKLKYDKLFDSSFYSCAVGAAKPDPAYFRKVVATLGVEPGEVGFVDDLAVNVAAAREVGLVAHQWQYGDDVDVLRALF